MNTYKPKDFAKMLGVTVRTLQKWDVAGKLKAFRTPTNRRFYTQEQLDVYMGNSTRVQNQKKVILYARVSTAKQRDDLKNQVSFLREFVNARGVIVDRVMTDIGSGLNLKRKNWNELIKMAEEGKVAEIYIASLTGSVSSVDLSLARSNTCSQSARMYLSFQYLLTFGLFR